MLTVFAQAAAAAPPAQPDVLHSGALRLMLDGGPFMWPILFMAVIATGVIIERLRSLKLIASNTHALRAKVLDLLHADRVEEAIALCAESRGPVPAVLAVGLQRYELLRRSGATPDRIEEQVTKAMDDYGVHITAALERHLPILATISNVAPMVGSVGTVVGMVVLFGDIVAKVGGSESIIKVAAAGIQMKLLVTAFGLLVGIPAYIFHNYFNSVINRFILDVEATATQTLEALTLRLATAEGAQAGPNRPAPAKIS
ncbi:MotA/TolQ/ExbB proton channel family protein [Fimbriiglobus ruber]|uniref:MotA/TolQ/ExbB proton channel family protein n=1 Tax=Fimbriiglobus ruber TaxID=1908690 RepID=A0A225DAR7_9BACT|nr:MotA/TolQ/ExbB proton channel family protein [Fimbriiglobus ruber]OWK35638.1 MotA/TolQ/ExbB proton channel family protein [Fimbriiglobus ruber]